MNANWIISFLAAHDVAVCSIASVLAAAFIHTMPAKFPGSLQEMWSWVRDGLQTAIPARRTEAPANPTMPAGPAQSK
jgi:hypothetical protein